MANKNREKSAGIALLLSFVPGLGAIYNGELMKGISYMGIFAFFIYLLDEPAINTFEAIFLALALTGFYFYTIVEAYNKAKVSSGNLTRDKSTAKVEVKPIEQTDPLVSVTIILFGILFLLVNYHVINWNSVRNYWPIVLIILGGKLVYNYFKGGKK